MCCVPIWINIFSNSCIWNDVKHGVASSEGGKTREYNCFCDELILANFGRNLLHFWKHLTAVSGTKRRELKLQIVDCVQSMLHKHHLIQFSRPLLGICCLYVFHISGYTSKWAVKQLTDPPTLKQTLIFKQLSQYFQFNTERDSTNKNGYLLKLFWAIITQVISQNALLKMHCFSTSPVFSYTLYLF